MEKDSGVTQCLMAIITNVAMKVEGLKLNYIDIDLIPIHNSGDMLDTNILAQ